MKNPNIKNNAFTFFALAALACCQATSAFAGADYASSLKAGDAALETNKDLALSEYEAATTQGTSDGATAFAQAKKAYVLAFKFKDYAKARAAVEEAQKVTQLSPVAEMTVLQVLAECQMRDEKNYKEAAANLEKAVALPGNAPAIPYLNLNLADCYRENGDFQKAIKTCEAVLATPGLPAAAQSAAYFSMAMTYQYGLLDFENAKKSYTKAGELNPATKENAKVHLSKMP